MFYKKILVISMMTTMMYGCVSTGGKLSTDKFKNYTSVHELIVKQAFNQDDGTAKEYVYDWGAHAGNKTPQSLHPKQDLNSYCQAKGGTLTLLHKSHLALVKDTWSKRLLETYGAVKQGIGAYQCKQSDGLQWIVSIEPTSERKLQENKDVRVVSLLVKEMTMDEAKKVYAEKNKNNSSTTVVKQPVVTTHKVIPAKVPEVKKEEKTVVPPPEPVKEAPKETIQQQQQRLYLSARRDFNRGTSQLAACNQAERAHNLGRFYNASGPSVYVESGVLVAKCLTTVSAYQKKFNQPKARAKSILQNIVSMQNHTIAKHMLQQLQ